jgi:two-component system sensor histidine kinase/response regulator
MTDVVALPVLPSTLLETFARALGRLGPASHVEAIPEAPSLRGRVLLVEDNDINREIGVQLLQQFGLDVVEASHGQEAIEVYRAILDDPDGAPIDLVLMDVQMPGMDGLTAAATLRRIEHPAAASVPIVAMTAHGTREDRERSLVAGMNDHLTKPVDPNDLARTVRRWLSKSTGPLSSRSPYSPGGTDDTGWA